MPANYDSIINKLSEDPEFLDLESADQDQLIEELAQEQMGTVPKPENLLQRVIKSQRMGPFGGTSITAAVPTTGQEAIDLGKVGIRQIVPDQSGPVGIGAKMAGVKGDINLPAPETEYGKNLENSANIAQLLHLGGAAGSIAKNGISKFFSKGNLPKEVEATKGSIQDIIHNGPRKVKDGISDIFNDSQKEFGKRIENIPGNFNAQMTSDHFYEALENTAMKLGNSKVAGSSGDFIMKLAQEIKNNPNTFYPKDIQAMTKSIMDKLPGTQLKSEFYSNFMNVLEREVPQLASLKHEYAPVYDIAKRSKIINKGNLARVASDRIGPEQLGEMAQAQQMMNDSPNVVEQAYASGKKLRGQQNDLQKIIERQGMLRRGVKRAAWGGAGYGIYNLLKGDRD